jgi:molybdate transport system permease protein
MNWQPLRRLVLPLVASLAVLFIALPCLALILGIGGADLRAAWQGGEIVDALLISAQTSLIALAICLFLGTPTAYLLARAEFPAKRFVESIVLLPLVLPPVVGGVALLMAFGRRGLLGNTLEACGLEIPFTMLAVVMAQVFMALPFYVQAAKAGFQGVPKHLEEASRTLGISEGQTFLRVTVPLSWPALMSGAVLCWGRAVGEFGATIMFAGNIRGVTRTMPLAILTAMQGDLGPAVVLAVILLVFSTLVFVTTQWTVGRYGLKS